MKLLSVCFAVFALCFYSQAPPMSTAKYVAFTTPGIVPFDPTQVPNASLFLWHKDQPVGAISFWTNRMNTTMRYTNMGTTIPSNSALGMYFDGTNGNFFKNANGARMIATNDSIWVLINYAPNSQVALGCLLSFEAAGGSGFFIKSSSVNKSDWLFVGHPDQDPFDNFNTASLLNYSITFKPFSVNSTTILCTTNNQGAASISGGDARTGNTILWGIGQDANSDNNFRGYVRGVLICTNYSFTTTDILNLYNWGQSN